MDVCKIQFHQISYDIDVLRRKASNDGEDDISNSGIEIDDSEDDSSSLFYQPGKTGFYSPRPGKGTEERLNCFRNVGRYTSGPHFVWD